MASTVKSPTMHFLYDKEDIHGNRVYGHEERANALMECCKENGFQVIDLTVTQASFVGEDGILFADFADRISMGPRMMTAGFVVEIADTHILQTPNPNVVVNHNFVPPYTRYAAQWGQFLGPKYFIRRTIFNDVKIGNDYTVVCVTGGNSQGFYNKVSHPDIAKLCKRYAYQLVWIEKKMYTKSRFAQILANAGIVIAPASMIALEALSLNKPTFVVQTAPDQKWNYEFLDDPDQTVGQTYSLYKLELLMRNPHHTSWSWGAGVVNGEGGTQAVIENVLRSYNDYRTQRDRNYS